jgi:hypothetical protein
VISLGTANQNNRILDLEENSLRVREEKLVLDRSKESG